MNKKVYESPELVVFGNIETLTAGGSSVGDIDALIYFFTHRGDPDGSPCTPFTPCGGSGS